MDRFDDLAFVILNELNLSWHNLPEELGFRLRIDLELLLRRPGEGGKFVTKLKLVQVRRADKLGIADILTSWQQLPVQKDDVVFY